MNTFFDAVKNGGDHWENYLEGKVQTAHCWNRIFTNGANNDMHRFLLCEMTGKESRRVFQDWEVTRG